MFVSRIIKDHYKSLPIGWIIGSHAAPLVLLLVYVRGWRPDDGQLQAVITAVSIYSALLFGILIPAGDQAVRLKKEIKQLGPVETTEEKLRLKQLKDHRSVARDILSNVAYSIIVSLATVIALIGTLCTLPPEGKIPTPAPEPGFWFFLYLATYLFGFLLMVLLMVVRTVYSSWFAESE